MSGGSATWTDGGCYLEWQGQRLEVRPPETGRATVLVRASNAARREVLIELPAALFGFLVGHMASQLAGAPLPGAGADAGGDPVDLGERWALLEREPDPDPDDRCTTCDATRAEITEHGHRWRMPDGRYVSAPTEAGELPPYRSLPCKEACTCLPECFSMDEHRAERAVLNNGAPLVERWSGLWPGEPSDAAHRRCRCGHARGHHAAPVKQASSGPGPYSFRAGFGECCRCGCDAFLQVPGYGRRAAPPCPRCEGTGQTRTHTHSVGPALGPCGNCAGTGTVPA